MTQMEDAALACGRNPASVTRVKVVGSKGTFNGVRKTLPQALAAPRRYAAPLDAPRSVI
jgi:hypothetical protein